MILLWLWQSTMFYEYHSAELEVQQTSRWLDGKKKKGEGRTSPAFHFLLCLFFFWTKQTCCWCDITSSLLTRLNEHCHLNIIITQMEMVNGHAFASHQESHNTSVLTHWWNRHLTTIQCLAQGHLDRYPGDHILDVPPAPAHLMHVVSTSTSSAEAW